MPGFPLNDKRAPQDAPVRQETNGANGVWRWQVMIGDQRVRVELTNGELISLAWRANKNKSGTASQGGLHARKVKDRNLGPFADK